MKTFEQAWADKVSEGYDYGAEALEVVRFGWELRAAEELASGIAGHEALADAFADVALTRDVSKDAVVSSLADLLGRVSRLGMRLALDLWAENLACRGDHEMAEYVRRVAASDDVEATLRQLRDKARS